MTSLAPHAVAPGTPDQAVIDAARAPFWSWPAKVLLMLGVVPVVIALIFGIDTVEAALILSLPIALWTILLLMWVVAAGRVVAGALVGYRLERFIFGPVALYRRDSGWLVTGNAHLTSMVGDTLSLDPRGNYPVWRTKIYIRGGTLGALGGGIAIWLLWVVLATADPYETYPPIVWCAQVGMFFGAIAVFVIIGLLDTYLISRIKKVGAQGVLGEIGFHSTGNNRQVIDSRSRPNEWDRATVVSMTALGRLPMRSTRAMHDAYQHFLDCGDTAAAWRYLAQAFAAAAPMSLDRSRIHLEYAYMQAYYRRRPDLARVVLESTSPDDDLRLVRLRAEAATLAAEGKHEQAMEVAIEALRAAGAMSNASQAAAETERITGIIAEIKRATT